MRVTGSVLSMLVLAGALPAATRAQAALGGQPEAVVAAAYARAISNADIAGGLHLVSPDGLDTLLNVVLRDPNASDVATRMLELTSPNALSDAESAQAFTQLLGRAPPMPYNVLAFGTDSVRCVGGARAYRVEEQTICLVGTRDSAWVAVPGRLESFVQGFVVGSAHPSHQ